MNFRKVTKNDVSIIVEMIADDQFGKKRENFQQPIPKEYLIAFEKINADENQELIVVENDNSEIIGTLQLSFIQYLTYQGVIRAQIEAVRVRKDKEDLELEKKCFNGQLTKQKKETHTCYN